MRFLGFVFAVAAMLAATKSSAAPEEIGFSDLVDPLAVVRSSLVERPVIHCDDDDDLWKLTQGWFAESTAGFGDRAKFDVQIQHACGTI